MTKWTGRLRNIAASQKEKDSQVLGDQTHSEDPDDEHEGWRYLNRVRSKLDKLVEDFSQGRVNRAQFEELYTHYHDERRAVERLISSHPSSDAWRMAVTEGQSLNIRRRLAARALGYAVYTNKEGRPLREYGEFTTLQAKWVSPLLNRIRKESEQLFVVESFVTGGEEKYCLCGVLGQFTTLLVLFSHEPARVQLQALEDLHCHFEQANSRLFAPSRQPEAHLDSQDLVFPYAAAFE